jgi:quercetin dioxygenase-like cupin family protein
MALKHQGGKMMKQAGLIASIALGLTFSATAQAQTTKRTELAKGDLTGTNMEVVVGTIEAAPGTTAILHTHAGEEAVYVLSGATAVTPDGKPIVFEPGTAKINVRDVPRVHRYRRQDAQASHRPYRRQGQAIVYSGQALSADHPY